MGFDITYHPISKEEIKKYCLNVVIDPGLAEETKNLLTKKQEEREQILDPIFKEMQKAKTSIMETLKRVQNREEIDDENKKLSYQYGRIPYCCAAIAGFLHPYFYARGACLAFLCEKEEYFTKYLESIYDIKPVFYNAGDKTATYEPRMSSAIYILENYKGGGYVAYEKLNELKKDLLDPKFKKVIDKYFGKEKGAILETIEYCLKKKIGFIEASDIVVPLDNKFTSAPQNLRAAFLKNNGPDNASSWLQRYA